MKNAIESLISRFRALSIVKRGFVLTFAVVACFVVMTLLTRPATKMAGVPGPGYLPVENPAIAPQTDAEFYVMQKEDEETRTNVTVPGAPVPRAAGPMGGALPYPAPLIAHTAELAVATKEFANSRTELEEILQRHRGYAAKLRMVGRKSGSALSATLRVPAPELGSTVSDLKALGDVEQEEQSADEVTQQRADLEARLSNAQNTLRRLQELLKKQTYPDGNVRELQRQIGNVSAEINRLEAERLASEHRIVFANVQFSLREVVSAPTESLSAQLHDAAAAGFGEGAASLSAILLFFIGRGPVVLLWMAILFFPARLVWKRLQPVSVPAGAPAQGN
jgi:Domain of unknown function (DUF4349)